MESEQIPDYEPHFERTSTERRVLGHITDEDHVGRGPRNTAERLELELSEDPNTQYGGNSEQLQGYLDSLEQAGLIEKHDDGTLSVTEAGVTELSN